MNHDRLARRLSHRLARDRLARAVRDAAREHEARAWVVGGFVRDVALGRTPGDLDLIAGRGAARLLPALRHGWSTAGFRFRKRGVTTWRFAVGDRRVDIVDASRRGLLKDLQRRDFTMNAIAFDLVSGQVDDPLGGLRDLLAHRLRLPGDDVIRQDPVRALRAARFMAQLPEFELDRRARSRVALAARGLSRVSAERLRDELDKLLAATAPVRGLRALDDLGLLGAILPELLPLARCRAGAGRPDVWTHTLDAIALSARGRLPGGATLRDAALQRRLRWSLLLHDIAKPETLDVREDGRPTFHGHEVLGAERADTLLSRLRLPRDERRRICRLILQHLRPGHLADAGAPVRGMRRLVREAGSDLPLLVRHSACDALASGSPDAERRWRRLRRVLERLTEMWETRRTAALPVLVTGNDVQRETGVLPGPRIGAMLARIRDLQEDGKLTTREAALAWLRRQA